MMHPPFRAARLGAALLTTAVLAACSGNDVLGPPDGAACTVGAIAPGDSVNGVVSAASCEVFDPDNYVVTFADAWTFNAKKGNVYIVRMRHQQDTAANDHLNATLEAFGRDAHGDATFVTGWWGNFGTSNGNGGRDEEMFLTADADRTLSIRVSSSTKADTGAYSLSIATCPLTPVADTVTRTGIDLAGGCPAFSINPAPMKLTFYSFQADSIHPDTAFVSRTAGTDSVWSYIVGPGFDFNCWGSCSSAGNSLTTGVNLRVAPALPGQYIFAAGVRSDSTATISFTIHATAPLSATAPIATAPFVGPHHGSR